MRHRGSRSRSVADRLERVAFSLRHTDAGTITGGMLSGVGVGSRLIATLLYLLCLLSLPPLSLLPPLLYAAYIVVLSRLMGVAYRLVMLRSLIVLPFVLVVGIFNPLLERDVAFTLFGISVGSGWVSLLTLTMRGVLAAQSVILLIAASGFGMVCGALRSFGVPRLIVGMVVQLHRHLFSLIDEALCMSRAVAARGYGRSSFPPRLWATFVGQLLLRSIDRAERVDRAMCARGFNGYILPPLKQKWGAIDTFYLIASLIVLLAIRMI